MSPILFGTDGGKGVGKGTHDCIIIYHTMAGGQKGALNTTGGVAAVRCGKYKAHYWTKSSVKVRCGSSNVKVRCGSSVCCRENKDVLWE
jgi:hypothetical protein